MVQYVPTDWKDSPSSETPIDATALNNIELGVSTAINRATEFCEYFPNWVSASAVGNEFSKIGNLVVANFSAKIDTTEGNNFFLATIPEDMRPSQILPFPAIFVPTGSTNYQARMVMLNTNGTIQVANNPTETGAFYCAMVYFIF